MNALLDSEPVVQTESETADVHQTRMAEADLDEIVRRLAQTRDAVEAPARLEKNRRYLNRVAGSSVKLNFVLSVGLVMSIGLNCALGYFAVHPDRQYFATDNGRMFPMIPMSQPYRKTADVIQYAADTLNRSFTLNFQDYRQQLEDNRARWTKAGFKSFLDNLQSSGVLASVKQRRMNMSMTAGTGVLVKEAIQDGVYFWVVQMPIEVKLVGQTNELPPQRYLATVKVERVSTLDSIEGIGLSQLITRPL
ncbi:DotI/IcmL/TraM family protein [Stutzerimonas nitrititolerans]|uniref:DotI/IcmL/TraM family protein n=1 Tax=Stutzerimonas nitrititolerans TaxID=2482751 RepID=UPI0028A6577A|nr:DotI/IcmL/TraM family protein [Stutzerimonas nitrititolerans]